MQQEYAVVARWHPSIRGALTLSWVGGWLLLVGVAVIADLVTRGPISARETLVYGALFLALFVGLPWALARMLRRRTNGGRAFLDP